MHTCSTEHLDILWGQNVHVDVIPEVLAALRLHSDSGPEMDSSWQHGSLATSKVTVMDATQVTSDGVTDGTISD